MLVLVKQKSLSGAIFKCVMDGCQAAMLAPTTVLAQQHFDNLRQRMAGFPVNIGL